MDLLEQIDRVESAVRQLHDAGVTVESVHCIAGDEPPMIVCRGRPEAPYTAAIDGCQLHWHRPANVCRMCGCSDLHACDDGGRPCFWAQPQLCSRCARQAGVDVEALRPADAGEARGEEIVHPFSTGGGLERWP
jgi:hypothetical protein